MTRRGLYGVNSRHIWIDGVRNFVYVYIVSQDFDADTGVDLANYVHVID